VVSALFDTARAARHPHGDRARPTIATTSRKPTSQAADAYMLGGIMAARSTS